MQKIVAIVCCSFLFLTGCGGEKKGDSKTSVGTEKKEASNKTAKIDADVELSCGQCNFGMAGDGCTLAVRIDGKGYYVEGSGIDDHGDAHADDGICNCVRKAKVVGEIVDGKFKAESIKLLEMAKK